MKKQKRVTAIALLIGILLFCSQGCAKKNAGVDVHVFYYTYSDPYISSVRASLDKHLSDLGIKYQDHDASGSQTTQTEQIQTAITKGAKAVIVNIVNTGSDDAAGEIVSLAKNADIPVIFFNREVSDSITSSYDKCVFVGTKAEEAGILQGEMIGEYLLADYDAVDLNGDGRISYILFKGEEGNNEAIYRTQYSVSEANRILREAKKPEMVFYDPQNPNKYLVDRNGQWSASAANEYMTTALASYSTENKNMIELVICNNDGMAEGAISALNAAGYNLGEGSVNIPVFGVDATDAARDLIAKGRMSGTVRQDSDGMAKAIAKLASNALTDPSNLLSGMEGYSIDSNGSKIRIAYSKYLGE